ncbi:MAG: hypothetical protein WBI07_07995 [Mobilitalea sp.]
MVLRGKTDYKAELSTSPVGNMVKLENLFHGLSENEDYLLKKIEQYKWDMEQSRQEYEKPFAHEEDLRSKIVRLNELNTQLDLENGKLEDLDLSEKDQDRKGVQVAERGNGYYAGSSNKSR